MQDKVTNYLETAFGKKVRYEGNTIKINIDELDGVGVYHLNAFNMERYKDKVESVKIKRSGTGLVVIVEMK